VQLLKLNDDDNIWLILRVLSPHLSPDLSFSGSINLKIWTALPYSPCLYSQQCGDNNVRKQLTWGTFRKETGCQLRCRSTEISSQRKNKWALRCLQNTAAHD